MEAVRIFIIINSQYSINHRHSLTRESNHSFNNILISHPILNTTSEWPIRFTISKHNNLSALRNVLLAQKMRNRHWYTINDNSIVTMQSILHGNTHYIIRTKHESI